MSLQEAVEARVAEVRETFLAEGGGTPALSLYLIGGFARGEGTCDLHEGRLRVYNDLDLLVVLQRRAPLALLRLWRVLRRLNDGRFDHQVDLEIITAPELLRLPSTIREADIRGGSRLLWGEDLLANLPSPFEARIRPGDIAQLLLNRQASGLHGLKESSQERPRIPYLQVQISKPLLAMAAAALALEGQYVTAVSEQVQRLKTGYGPDRESALGRMLEAPELRELLETAIAFKSRPEPKHFAPYEETLEQVLALFHPFLLAALARIYGLEEGSADGPEVMQALRQRQPRRLRLLTPSWWAHALRASAAGLFPRHPGWRMHPLVDVYCAQTLWLEERLQGLPTEEDSSREQVTKLLKAWNVASYGCRLE